MPLACKITGAPTSYPPSGSASGDLTGTYPAPTVAAGAIGNSKLASDAASLNKVSGGSMTMNGSNVGIGTPSAGQKLTVAGTIESTSGGFKFPDGSVQSSAPLALATYFHGSSNATTTLQSGTTTQIAPPAATLASGISVNGNGLTPGNVGWYRIRIAAEVVNNSGSSADVSIGVRDFFPFTLYQPSLSAATVPAGAAQVIVSEFVFHYTAAGDILQIVANTSGPGITVAPRTVAGSPSYSLNVDADRIQ